MSEVSVSIRRFAVRLSVCVVLLGALAPFASSQNASPAAPAASGSQKTAKRDKIQTDANGAVTSDANEVTDAVADAVLRQIRDGLESHSQGMFLSAFDRDKFDGYLAFEDQVQAFFEKYEGFRTHFRILQISTEGAKGVVLAEFDVEGTSSGGGPAMRRSSQLRFELAKGSKGWKVVDIRPRGFFS
jgi:ketosteroid isomerase-like protein